MKRKRKKIRNRMKSFLLLCALALLAGSGCGTALNWKRVDHILPRESPRLAAARFQLALLDGKSSDSFESLTEVSKEAIPYAGWLLIMPGQKHPELDITIFDLLIDSKVEACYETDTKDILGRPVAELLAFHDGVNEGQTVYLFQEKEEWKIGLVETFMPDKAKEIIDDMLKKRAQEYAKAIKQARELAENKKFKEAAQVLKVFAARYPEEEPVVKEALKSAAAYEKMASEETGP